MTTSLALIAHRAAAADMTAALDALTVATETGHPEALAMAQRRVNETAAALTDASRRLSKTDRLAIATTAPKPVAPFGTVHAPSIGAAETEGIDLATQRLARNRRTPGLYCARCDAALPIGSTYALVQSIALCRPCARPHRAPLVGPARPTTLAAWTDGTRTRVLITGSVEQIRSNDLADLVRRTVAPGSIVMHGAARGADSIAGAALAPTCTVLTRPADWNRYGRSAGVIRNVQMLNEHRPHIVVALFGQPWEESRGTRHTVTEARKRDIPVLAFRTDIAGTPRFTPPIDGWTTADPITRSGIALADEQTERDDMLDTATAMQMTTHAALRRTVHELDNSTAAEQNADPIDEIEDETTPDVPNWTPTHWPRRPFTVKQIAPGIDGLGRYVAGAIVLGDRWSNRLDAYAHLGIPQQCRRLAAPRIGPHLYQRADD